MGTRMPEGKSREGTTSHTRTRPRRGQTVSGPWGPGQEHLRLSCCSGPGATQTQQPRPHYSQLTGSAPSTLHYTGPTGRLWGSRAGRTGAARQGLSFTARARLHSQTLGNRSARGARVTAEDRQPHKVPLLPEGRRRGRLRRPWEKTPPPQGPEGRKGRQAGSGEKWGTGLARSPGGCSRDGGEVARAGQAREGRSMAGGRAPGAPGSDSETRRGRGGVGEGLHAQRALPGAWPQG